jgi:hypothetical protein
VRSGTWLLALVLPGGALAEKIAERGVTREVGLQPAEAHRRPVRQHLLVDREPRIRVRHYDAAQTRYGVTLTLVPAAVA